MAGRGPAILDLVGASILLPFDIFMTCSFFGIHFGFQIRNVTKAEESKRSLRKSTASIRPTAKASGWKSTPDTIWLTFAILVFSGQPNYERVADSLQAEIFNLVFRGREKQYEVVRVGF
jgi:hypothetical protein